MPWYGLNHVHLVCSEEMEAETVEFYTEVMGFDLEREIDRPDGRKALIFGDGTYGKLYFFVIDEDGPHGELLPNNQAPFSGFSDEDPDTMPYASGVHHVSWGVESEKELEYIKDRIEQFGYETYGPINRHNFAYDLYFEDPNGINLEIYTPGPKAGTSGETRSERETTNMPTENPDEKQMEGVEHDPGVVRRGAEDGVAKELASSYWKLPGRSTFHDSE